MIRRAVLNVAVGGWYSKPGGGQERLWYSLEERGENTTRLFWRDEYPPNSPTHQDAPYAFKIHAFQHARQLGFDQAVWLDASCWLLRDLSEIWAQIAMDGYYLEPDSNGAGEWTDDRALELLGVSRDEALTIPLVEGKCFGLDFRDDSANAFLDELHRLADEGAVSCSSLLAWSFGLKLQALKRVWFPAQGEPSEHAVLLAQGM